VSRGATIERSPVSAETRQRLNSLGYVAGTASVREGALRNPMELAALAYRIEKAITLEHSDPATAVREFRAALQEDPDNVMAREHLAMALSRVRRFDEALAEAKPLMAAGDTSADLMTLVGECLRVTGRYDEALDAFRRASDKDPRWGGVTRGARRSPEC
jgi:Tfp pilus assembly protein PilF